MRRSWCHSRRIRRALRVKGIQVQGVPGAVQCLGASRYPSLCAPRGGRHDHADRAGARRWPPRGRVPGCPAARRSRHGRCRRAPGRPSSTWRSKSLPAGDSAVRTWVAPCWASSSNCAATEASSGSAGRAPARPVGQLPVPPRATPNSALSSRCCRTSAPRPRAGRSWSRGGSGADRGVIMCPSSRVHQRRTRRGVARGPRGGGRRTSARTHQRSMRPAPQDALTPLACPVHDFRHGRRRPPRRLNPGAVSPSSDPAAPAGPAGRRPAYAQMGSSIFPFMLAIMCVGIVLSARAHRRAVQFGPSSPMAPSSSSLFSYILGATPSRFMARWPRGGHHHGLHRQRGERRHGLLDHHRAARAGRRLLHAKQSPLEPVLGSGLAGGAGRRAAKPPGGRASTPHHVDRQEAPPGEGLYARLASSTGLGELIDTIPFLHHRRAVIGLTTLASGRTTRVVGFVQGGPAVPADARDRPRSGDQGPRTHLSAGACRPRRRALRTQNSCALHRGHLLDFAHLFGGRRGNLATRRRGNAAIPRCSPASDQSRHRRLEGLPALARASTARSRGHWPRCSNCRKSATVVPRVRADSSRRPPLRAHRLIHLTPGRSGGQQVVHLRQVPAAVVGMELKQKRSASVTRFTRARRCPPGRRRVPTASGVGAVRRP